MWTKHPFRPRGDRWGPLAPEMEFAHPFGHSTPLGRAGIDGAPFAFPMYFPSRLNQDDAMMSRTAISEKRSARAEQSKIMMVMIRRMSRSYGKCKGSGCQ